MCGRPRLKNPPDCEVFHGQPLTLHLMMQRDLKNIFV